MGGEKKPRIVSLSPNITDILIEFGLEKNIVGSTRFCKIKGEKIGGWIDLDYDKIKSLNPDYVFSCIFKPKIETIHFDVKTLEDIYSMIKELGNIFNKEERAKELISFMKTEFKKIEEESKKRKKLRIYCEEFPYYVAGNWVPEIIEICNGMSLHKKGERSRRISDEELINFNPDIIILHWCGIKPNIKSIYKRKGWENINAVKQKNIFIIEDDYLNKPNHWLVKGALELNKKINSVLNDFMSNAFIQ